MKRRGVPAKVLRYHRRFAVAAVLAPIGINKLSDRTFLASFDFFPAYHKVDPTEVFVHYNPFGVSNVGFLVLVLPRGVDYLCRS